MASVEEVSTQFAHTTPVESTLNNTKRKRDESVEIDKYTNGVQEVQTKATNTIVDHDFIRDLICVLKLEDPSVSVLSRPIPDSIASNEPQLKRQKSDAGNETEATILTRCDAQEYKTVDEILSDIDVLVIGIREELRAQKGDSRTQYLADSDKLVEVTAFQERAHGLVAREKAYRANKEIDRGKGHNLESKTVLTLYGNAPGPKQLFSSFQQPIRKAAENIDAVQPVHESALPNGISTTKIISPQTSGVIAADKNRTKTLGELFPAPSSLAVMQPPKPSKLATTRANIVGWYQPTPKDPSPRALGYLTQNIVAGQWLDYSKPLASQDAKRRSRDRALSLTSTKVLEPESAESEAAKLDALFRSAYSGFAPTKDHSAAVASEGHVNRIWWQKNGEKAYGRFLANSVIEEDTANTDTDMSESLEELDIAKLEGLAEIDPDTIDPSLVPLGNVVKKSAEEKDTEEVLADISDLLETLNSYQRIRHMSLNSARPGGILSTTDSSGAGTPYKPGESEQLTYETLKTSLKLMIQTLPPYAVAKLNPDRLAELSISTKIEIAEEEYKGVMEEDEASARARAALAAAASRTPNTAPLHRSGSSNQLYGNQYSGQPGSGSHLYRPNTTHTPVRPPTNSYQRPPATVSAPYQGRPNPVPSPAYRPSFNGPTYPPQGQPNARQTPIQYQGSAPYPGPNQQYQHANNPPAYMRPQSQGQAYPQTAQAVPPQHPMNGGYSRQGFPQQSQPLQNGMTYQYAQNNLGRQNSPQRMYSPQTTPASPRQYSTPTPTPSQGPSRPPAYMQNAIPHNHINGTPSQTPQTAYQRQQPGNHMGYSTFMTSAEQNNLLERQRAQLAQQQGMQQQARTAAQAALGSPSPATNGTYSVTAGQ